MIFKILDTRSAKQSGKLVELRSKGAVQRARVSDMEHMMEREVGFSAHGHRNSHSRYKIETSSTQATGEHIKKATTKESYSWPHSHHKGGRLDVPWRHVEFVQKRGLG